jgi:alkylation response protein AidB-like acyl-CoA dehydrogenase
MDLHKRRLRLGTALLGTVIVLSCAGPGSGGLDDGGSPPSTDAGDGAQRFVLSTTTISVSEGASATLTVALARDPGGAVFCGPGFAHPGPQRVTPSMVEFSSATYATPVQLATDRLLNLWTNHYQQP